ncbi:MAG: DUF502 domain-containing protein [Pseudomonadota bacterium]
MERFKSFFKTSLIGGITVILPMFIFVMVTKWLFGWVTDIIRPITSLVVTQSHLSQFIADALIIALIIIGCFIIGVIVKTKAGQYIHTRLEKRMLKVAPGYSVIKETVMQLVGKKFPFSEVVLVRIYENSSLLTGFITDTHKDGIYTVFIPTSPNPTSGYIYHLKSEFVYHVDISVEEAMRTILTCGTGSGKIIDSYLKQIAEK